MTELTFKQAKEKHFEKLEQFTPIVQRVHGDNHPEIREVKALFDQINKKTQKADADEPELEAEFTQLRVITDNYTVPNDVCESYEAVYNMLAEVDVAYQA